MVRSTSLSVILLLVTLAGAHFEDVRNDLRHFESISDLKLRAHGVSRRRLTFDSLHQTDGLRAAGYPKDLELSFFAFGKQRTINLQKNSELFVPSYAEVNMLPNGSFVHHSNGRETVHCHYRGLVDGDIYSDALVSLCNDRLHATVLTEDSSFEIHHIGSKEGVRDQIGSEEAPRHHYIAYRLSDYRPMDNATCGGQFPGEEEGHAEHSHEHRVGMMPGYPSAHSSSTAHRRRRLQNQCANRNKYVEIVVVNDLLQYENRGETVEQTTALAVSNMQALYDNIYDEKYFKYCIKLRLVGQITYRSKDPTALPNKLTGHKGETDIKHKVGH